VNTCRTEQPFAQHQVETSIRSMLRITLATMIGGAIEAFDFLAYGTATAVVFNKLFFRRLMPRPGNLQLSARLPRVSLRGPWVGSSSAISAIVSAARRCC
jgi:hypothetical protein